MGACFCTGACRRPPYRCAAGDWSRKYDPEYENNLRNEGALDLFLKLLNKSRRSKPRWRRPVVKERS